VKSAQPVEGFLKYLINGFRLEGTVTYHFQSDQFFGRMVTIDGETHDNMLDFYQGSNIDDANILDMQLHSTDEANYNQAVSLISNYANIDFQKVTNAADAFTSVFLASGNLLVDDKPSSGFAAYPKEFNNGGFVFLNEHAGYTFTAAADGADYKEWVALHEALHSVGRHLGHGWNRYN
jgi:hypothetical protein